VQKEKREVTVKFFLDGKLTGEQKVKLNVYRRKDGSEYVNYCRNKRELVGNVVECHARSLRAYTLAEIMAGISK
jgi:hypothetical protein